MTRFDHLMDEVRVRTRTLELHPTPFKLLELFFFVSFWMTYYSFYVILYVIFLGGSELIYHATVGSNENNKLKQKYLEHGLRVNGEVEKRWKTELPITNTNEQGDRVAIENAIVSYRGPDGYRYRMKLSPLDERTAKSIIVANNSNNNTNTPTPGQNHILPVVVLRDIPTSGIPVTHIDYLCNPICWRIVQFIFGSLFSAYLNYILLMCAFSGLGYIDLNDDVDVEASSDDPIPFIWEIMPVRIFIVGVVLIYSLQFAIISYKNKPKRREPNNQLHHPKLYFSERVQEGNCLVLPADQMKHNDYTGLLPWAVPVVTATSTAPSNNHSNAVEFGRGVTVEATSVHYEPIHCV